MNSDSEPEVLQAEWEPDQVEALFGDLEQGAEIQHVQVRTGLRDGQSDRAVTLSEAHALFKAGDAKAIQIRYSFNEQNWCDTLMVGPQVTQVIRTRIDNL